MYMRGSLCADKERVPRSSPITVYLSRKMAVLLALGFASGVPLGLTGATLQAWMTAAEVDLRTIGLLSVVGLPYTLKFLWAPAMDRFAPPVLGRRRGWLVLTQIACVLAILAMAATGASSLAALGLAALVVAFCSASQDIVADAYRTDVLEERERGAGAAVFVTGYRVAMLLTTGATLVAAEKLKLPWPTIYTLMAGAMGVGVLASLAAPEPAVVGAPPATFGAAVVRPFVEFVARRGWWAVLLFIVLFKAPDEMLNAVKIPFLERRAGFTPTQIGAVAQSFGLVMSIVGAILGGAVIARLGVWRSLWGVAVLQGLSNLAFYALLFTGPRTDALAAVTCVENLCGGLVTAAFVAFLMGQCDVRFSATQYALLSSLMAVTRQLAGAPSGYIAEGLGWEAFLPVTAAAALPALLLLPFVPMPKPRASEVAEDPSLAEPRVAPTMGG